MLKMKRGPGTVSVSYQLLSYKFDFVLLFKFAHLQVRFYIWDLGNAESDV